MKYYEEFKQSGNSFADRIGAPEEFDAAIGRVALSFSFLEDTARNVIVLLSGTDFKAGHIMAAQLSFRQRLDVMTSLVRLRSSTHPGSLEQSIGPEESDLAFRELYRLCLRAEELRNSYLHSSYSGLERAKVSAHGKHGLKVQREPVDAGLLLDVADFITYAGVELQDVPMLIGLADSVTDSADSVSYFKRGSLIATFKFGEVS